MRVQVGPEYAEKPYMKNTLSVFEVIGNAVKSRLQNQPGLC